MVWSVLRLETKEFLRNIRVDSNVPKALRLLKEFEFVSISISEDNFFGFNIPNRNNLRKEFEEIIKGYKNLSENDRKAITRYIVSIVGKYLKIHIRTSYYRIKKVEELIKQRKYKDSKLFLELEPSLSKVYVSRKYTYAPIMSLAEEEFGKWSLLPVNSSNIIVAKRKAFKELYDFLRFSFLL